MDGKFEVSLEKICIARNKRNRRSVHRSFYVGHYSKTVGDVDHRRLRTFVSLLDPAPQSLASHDLGKTPCSLVRLNHE
jgi:hypothetical protein